MIALILFIFYLALMLWSFGAMPLFIHSKLSSRGLAALFLIKLAFSIGLVLVYTYYYTDRGLADVYKYYDDGNAIYESVPAHPGGAFRVITGIGFDHDDPEVGSVLADTHHFDRKSEGAMDSNNRLIIRFNAVLRFFSYDSIYIHSLIFCFLAFMGTVALYRALQQFFEKDTGHLLIFPLFLMPSILFWSSGLLKETLMIFFLGMLIFTSIKLAGMKNMLLNLILFAICLHFLYLAKPFMALSFLVSFYAMATFYFKGYIRIISILVASLIGIWFFYTHNTFICEFMSSLLAKRNEFTRLGLNMKAGSLSDEHYYSGCMTVLKLLPMGFYAMFFQPFVWSHGLFEKIFGAENLFVLLLTICTAVFFKRPKDNKMLLAVFSFTFFMLNYTVIGITVPIIGALVRYKIFGLLFYLIFLISIVDLSKIIYVVYRQKYLILLAERVKKQLFR